MKPKVWNKRDPETPKDAVYVGRPSKWGNPFVIPRDGTREVVVWKFRKWLRLTAEGRRLRLAARRELRGRHLVCWCAPKPCHAYVLLEAANQ